MENIIRNFFDRGEWKEVELKHLFNESYQVFVSNYGQVKRFNKISNKESVFTQNKTEGYPSVNLRIMQSLTENEAAKFAIVRSNLLEMQRSIKTLQKDLLV